MTISETDKKKIETITDATIAKFIRELPKRVTIIMERAVLSLMGIRVGHNRTYEVDSFSKNSALQDLIKRRCQAQIDAVLAPLVEASLAKICTDDFITQMSYEIAGVFKRKLSQKLEEAASMAAFAKAEAIIKSFEESPPPANLYPIGADMADPNAWTTKVGVILLEEQLIKVLPDG